MLYKPTSVFHNQVSDSVVNMPVGNHSSKENICEELFAIPSPVIHDAENYTDVHIIAHLQLCITNDS